MFTRQRVLVVGPGGGIRGGIDSVIAAHRSSSIWEEYRCELIKTYSDSGLAGKLWTAVKAYIEFSLKVWRAGLVHIHLAGESSLLRKVPFVVLARLCRKPIVVHVHASSPESLFDKTPPWAVRLALSSADRVIALSSTWARSIAQRCSDAKVTIIPNPAVIPSVEDGPDCREPVVLYVGKLESRKGYADLIQAAREVTRVIPHARFVFAGHGEVRQAQELADSLQLSASIECLGWVTREQLPSLLNRAAVFCLPSYNEGVPMAMLEAMSYGLPIVATPVGGIPDLLRSGENGILVEPGDVAAFSRAIIRLLENKQDVRKRLGTAARETVRNSCGIENVAALLSGVYSEIAIANTRERLSPSSL